MNIEHRVARLERENRFLKRGLLGALLACGAAVGVGAAYQNKYAPVETTNLKLVTSNGKVRAELTSDPKNGNGMLKFYNWEDNAVLMEVGLDGDPMVRIFGRRAERQRNSVLTGETLVFTRSEDKSSVEVGYPYRNEQDQAPGMMINTGSGWMRVQQTR